jgi:hypothetical protein
MRTKRYDVWGDGPREHPEGEWVKFDDYAACLWKYGRHLTVCGLWAVPSARCDCGWVEVRALCSLDGTAASAVAGTGESD